MIELEACPNAKAKRLESEPSNETRRQNWKYCNRGTVQQQYTRGTPGRSALAGAPRPTQPRTDATGGDAASATDDKADDATEVSLSKPALPRCEKG